MNRTLQIKDFVMRIFPGFFMTAVVALAACAPAPDLQPIPDRPAKALPPAFFAQIEAAGLAKAVADECRLLRYDNRYEDRVVASLAGQMDASGYTSFDIDAGLATLDDRRVQQVTFDYIEKRDIIVWQEQTWCDAGNAEIVQDTAIGKYLIRR